tara:strand:- start:10163 stop:12442 length:2280 start_codon:yes stop_codon:yes gene_type:complete
MFLKQSTAYTFRFGPFLDDTDGKTAETGLTISQADIRLSKGGGNFAQKNESSTSTHDEIGFYIVVLDATDTNTCGELLVACHESGALPVFKTFYVLEEAIYDAMFGASANAFNSDGRVDVASIEGSDATDQINAACDTALSDYDAPTKAEMDSAFSTTNGKIDTVDDFLDTEVAAILADTNELQADWANGGRLDLLLDSVISKVDVVDGIVDTILVDTNELQTDWVNGGRLDLLLDSAISKIDVVDGIVDDILVDTGTTLDGKLDTIDDFLDTEVAAILADTNELQGDWANGGRLDLLLDSVISKVDVIDGIVDDILVDTGTTIPATLTTIDDFLDTEVAAILADTNELQGDWANGGRLDLLLDSVISKVDVIDGIVDNILVDTAEIGTAGAGLTAVPWNSSWDAEVQSECNDALVAIGLDHLVSASVAGSDVVDDSIIAKLVSKESTADWDDYVNTTDSLQALRDRGDSAWTTGGGGSAPTVAEIRAEMDSNSTQLAAIVADTNELQADWVNGGRLDLLLDSAISKIDVVDGIVDTILVDTNELQSDWVNGGRLDLLLDSAISKIDVVDGIVDDILVDTGTTLPSTLSTIDGIVDSILVDTGTTLPATLATIDGIVDDILVDTSTTLPATLATIDGIVDDILVDTAVIGANGAGLSAVPWNSAWDSEVQSEVTDALNAYDPPTKAEMDAMWTTAQSESYAADGAAATPAQLLYMIYCCVGEFAVSGTTITGKKLNGSDTAMTWTTDDGTNPTSRTRSG